MDCAQQDWLLSLREFQSHLSALADSFLFIATPPLAPSHSLPARFLWNSRAEDSSSRRRTCSHRFNARMPRRHHRESIRRSSSLNMISVPPRLRATWVCSVGVTMNWMTAFLWWLRTRKSYRSRWLTPPSCRCPLHATPDPERIRSLSMSWQRLSVSSDSSGLRLRCHLTAGCTNDFSQGAINPPANAHPPSSPKYKTNQIVAHPLLISHPSFCLLCPHLHWQRWREGIREPVPSGWVHGWKARASRAEPLLHSLDAPTRQLDKRLRRCTLWLCSRSSRPRCSPVRRPVLMQLHSGTWPYAPPRPTTQAIGWSMSSLVVLESHFWFTLVEMNETDKVPFLDAPVSSNSLFGPAEDGFVGRINTRSFHLGCPWLPALLHDTWMQLSPLCDRWEPASSTTSMTGSFWPSQRQFQHCTGPSSSATYVAWGSGSTLPRAYCHPANVLAEAEGSIRSLALRTPPHNGVYHSCPGGRTSSGWSRAWS